LRLRYGANRDGCGGLHDFEQHDFAVALLRIQWRPM
jgi:hypothetical protein